MTNDPRLTTHGHAELVSASIVPNRPKLSAEKWTLKQVEGDGVV
jgi:hypothetical protein